ncbi:hypothetical protein HMPREF0083_02449 [Aneurinibacillus aneurinilyticus ATCC 12856]|uniref:Uncharacterized protein n=1 Tax=Aneurinibacillus aneurinilyticus ATCC 12856 TaxID=649747 RepID=U1X3A8_ANEAE|nr:hypothetical protein HMPREF0083_02449 [Aneurinibacillus aneurinilyticus ATCC 12856]
MRVNVPRRKLNRGEEAIKIYKQKQKSTMKTLYLRMNVKPCVQPVEMVCLIAK